MDDIYIQKVLDGNQDAFRFLIKKYKNLSYSYAMSVVKDEFLAQEVLQISFIKAYTKLNTFKGNSKFSTWLYRIIVNEAFKMLNKRKREVALIDDKLIETNEIASDSIESATKEHQKYFVNEALKKLGPKESLALRLFYLEEHSVKDITEITGWNTTNIKVLLHRGRINMKKILVLNKTNNIETLAQWMN